MEEEEKLGEIQSAFVPSSLHENLQSSDWKVRTEAVTEVFYHLL